MYIIYVYVFIFIFCLLQIKFNLHVELVRVSSYKEKPISPHSYFMSSLLQFEWERSYLLLFSEE